MQTEFLLAYYLTGPAEPYLKVGDHVVTATTQKGMFQETLTYYNAYTPLTYICFVILSPSWELNFSLNVWLHSLVGSESQQ